ncbi:MAG: signal peptidase II [Planctomycetota bacterium]|jgi:signal peptidase II
MPSSVEVSAPATSTSGTLRGKGLALGIALMITASDLWSKAAVFASIADHEHHWIFGHWFGFTRVLNPGVMWGLGNEFSAFLPWVRTLAAVVVLGMLWSTPAAARLTQLALGLVLGGALGNIYDGFSIGKVRDFIEVDLGIRWFDPFPIFNIADSAICVGVGLLVLSILLDRREAQAAE